LIQYPLSVVLGNVRIVIVIVRDYWWAPANDCNLD